MDSGAWTVYVPITTPSHTQNEYHGRKLTLSHHPEDGRRITNEAQKTNPPKINMKKYERMRTVGMCFAIVLTCSCPSCLQLGWRRWATTATAFQDVAEVVWWAAQPFHPATLPSHEVYCSSRMPVIGRARGFKRGLFVRETGARGRRESG